MENRCELCNRTYEYRVTAAKRDTKSFCHNCVIGRSHYALRAACVAYKGGKCFLCGYSKVRGLNFHHMDPAQKDFNACSPSYAWERIKAELDKCALLCCNCHAEVHGELERLRFRRTDRGILKTLEAAHNMFKPDSSVQFSRADWKKFHPKYAE